MKELPRTSAALHMSLCYSSFHNIRTPTLLFLMHPSILPQGKEHAVPKLELS